MQWFNFSYAQITDTIYMNDSSFDAPIYYSADDSIYIDLKGNKIHLYNNAIIDNGEINMKAGYIMLDLENNEVLARYRFSEDSTETEYPQFSDGNESLTARTVRYNFNSEKAYIEQVSIQQDENFLYMEVAKKHPNDQIHFRKGRFTTCNLDEPHYHFQLSKAVMIPEKRIVTGPMNLWIKGVPTPLGLPFSIIPQVEEKTQGFTFPQIIPLSQYGFGFQDLGYFIPVNSSFQTTFYGSLYSRGSWGIRNQTEYNFKYKYSGGFNIGYQQFRSGFPENLNSNKVTVAWTHRADAKASPYWSFSSMVNFLSDNTSKNNLDPLNEQYFNNNFNSDITIGRRFPGKPITAGAKISLRQNSISENISVISPVVNVNVTRFFPFKNIIKKTDGFSGLFNKMAVSYDFEGQNKSDFKDTLLRNGDFQEIGNKFLNGITQKARIQTTASLFKNTWKLTPSFDYSNTINFQQTLKSYDVNTNSTQTDTINRTGMFHKLSGNAQLTTSLYTYYQFLGRNKPIMRHVLTPTFGFSYRPNLNQLISDSVGVNKEIIEYSPFQNSLYSNNTTSDQALITFGFNNTFEFKRRSDKDTVDGFKRTRIIELLSINGQYDLIKDSMNLSDLRLNLRINPLKWINIVTTSTFSPYDWIDSTGQTTSNYAIDARNTLGRFTQTNISTSLSFTSKESRDVMNSNTSQMDQNWNSDYEFYRLHPEQFIDFNIPWKINLSHVYSINTNTNITTTNSKKILTNQTILINGDVSITKRWKLATVSNFDINSLSITNARFTMTRNMHCWSLAFHWTPIGGNQSFLFSLRSTSKLFQDAKIDIRKPPAFL